MQYGFQQNSGLGYQLPDFAKPVTPANYKPNSNYASVVDLYPWIDDKDREEIHSSVQSLPLNQQAIEKQKLYEQKVKAKQQQQFMESRIAAKNDLYLKSQQEKDPVQKNNMDKTYRMANIADIARERVDIPAHVTDQEIVDRIVSKLPNGDRLFMDYMNGKDDKLITLLNNAPWGKQSKQIVQQQPDGNVVGDLAGWFAKSWSSTAELWANIGDWLGYNLVKAIYGEEKANQVKSQLWDSFGDTVNKTLQDAWVDTNSTSFSIGKGTWDFAQLLAGGEIVKWIPAVAKLVEGIKGAWQVAKVAWMAGEWAAQTVWYNLIADKELPSATEAWIGAWINVALWVGWQAVSKLLKTAGNKLQLSGLINPQKLEYVQNALKEWGDNVDNVTEWMNARNLVGSKKTIVSKLQAEGKKTFTAVRDAVKQADEVVQPIQDSSIKWAIEELIGVTQGVKSPQKKAVYDNLVSLLKKHDSIWLKPSEVQGVKDSLDELMSIYTLAWDVKAGVQKADLANLRSNIRGIIEDTVGKATWADIATLNRDTAVAYKLAEGIMKKSNAESARELLSPFAPSIIGWWIGWFRWDTREERLLWVVWWILWWKLLWSTYVKSNLGIWIKALWKKSIPARWVISGVIGDWIGEQLNKRRTK